MEEEEEEEEEELLMKFQRYKQLEPASEQNQGNPGPWQPFQPSLSRWGVLEAGYEVKQKDVKGTSLELEERLGHVGWT